LEFVVARQLRVLTWAALGLLVVVAALVTIGSPDFPYPSLLILTLIFAIICISRTFPLVIDDTGIFQARSFLPMKKIAWSDVASIRGGPYSELRYICSRSGGPSIRVSAYLVGSNRLEAELRKHLADGAIQLR